MEEIKNRIISLLKNTKREGIEKLIARMENNGFFEAPCSGAYHLAKEGGLAEHSLNVFEYMVKYCDAMFGNDYSLKNMHSIVICSLLHDLGKAGDHGKKNYVPNYVKSKTKNKETGEYDLVLSTAKPYVTNKELIYEEHEIRSVIIASRFIELTEEEESAILHHNGLFGKLDSSYGNHNYDATPLAFSLHTADMHVSRFVED